MNPNTRRSPLYLDAPAQADVASLIDFYGPVAPSVIVRRALSLLAQHVAGISALGNPEAAEERAAVLAFVKPRRVDA